MSTVTIARKDGCVAIAADTLTTFGPRKMSAAYNRRAGKIIKVGSSYVGLTGWSIHQQVLEHVFRPGSTPPGLSSRTEIFETFLRLHEHLKAAYFMTPRPAEHDVYEPTHVQAMIANEHGAFGVYSMRDVMEYQHFWASGSGSDYALGAMHAMYNTAADARSVAEAGVRASAEFDDATGAPIESHAVFLNEAALMTERLELLMKE